MSRKTLLLSCVVLFSLLIFALVVLSMLHKPHGPPRKTPPKIIWSQTYGGKREEQAYSFIQTSDGGYAIAGRTTSFGSDYSCFWLVKVDSSGTMEWNRIYEGTGIFIAENRAYSVVETSDGGYAIAGKIESSLYFYNPDFWLIKTDSSGNTEWNKTYGRPELDVAYSVVETSDGGYAIAGSTIASHGIRSDFWLVKTDRDGNMEWNQTYGGTKDDSAKSLVQTSDGGFALAGYTFSFGAGDFDVWLVKTDMYGNMEWNQTYGGAHFDSAYSLVETSDEGFVLAGYTNSFGVGSADFWLVKTDKNGNMEWNQTYGGTDSDYGHSVVETSDGGYAIAGQTSSFGAGDNDCWLVKVDSSGTMEWNQTYGGTNGGVAWCVQQTSDGGFALAGETYTFGFLEDIPNYDFWLVKTESMYDEADAIGGIPQFLLWIIVTVAIIGIGGVALLVYFGKIWKTT